MNPARIAFSCLVLVVALPCCAQGADRYGAPLAAGDGRGASPANAASYLDVRFWSTVGADVAHEPTTVHFAAGHYRAGPLTLTALGNDRHRLSLDGQGSGAVFDSGGDFLLYLKGCRNLRLHNLHFTGSAGKFGVTVIGLSRERRDAIIPVPAQSMHADIAGERPARDIDFDGCSWIDLPNVYYGPLCLSFHTDHITVQNCTFRRCGQERHCHMMYNGGGSHHIFIYHNTFEDCSGTYVRFRDRSDYGYVFDNTFRTTGGFAHEDPSTAAFIEVPLFNSFDPGNESFGTNFYVIGNRFVWPDRPPHRDAQDPVAQLHYHTRDALRFWQDGFETRGYRTLLTKDEGYTLSLGSPAAKRALLLANCGINLDRLVWYGNRYAGAMQSKATYACLTEFGAFAKSRGFESYADISNALTRRPLFRDDFEADPAIPVGWEVRQDPGTTVAKRFANGPASAGGRAMFLGDRSVDGACSLRRRCALQDGFTFSAWFHFGETTGNHVCLGVDGRPWVVAAADGYWENDRGRCISGATYQANTWYHVEVAMEEGAKDYSIWIDGVLISKDIKDPAEHPVAAAQGELELSPAEGRGTGSMLVDDVEVAALGEEEQGIAVRQARPLDAHTLRVTFSAPLDVSEGVRGAHSALNPLNFQVSRRFFPEYGLNPVRVAQVDRATYDVTYLEALPNAGGYLWTMTLRGADGGALSPTGRIRAIDAP